MVDRSNNNFTGLEAAETLPWDPSNTWWLMGYVE